ncbi:MAG TPA: cytochrome P450 [Bradyrhizobium sp.]|jgi:cytochrome P450|nr:cytochrome P450 [Bradyrhizobium sp.]
MSVEALAGAESAAVDTTDLIGEAITRSPYEYLAQLRETSPVHWNDRHRAWVVTRYADVQAGFRDARLASNRLKHYREKRIKDEEQATIGRTLRILESWMVFQDNPEHKRLRSVVHRAFTMQTVAALEQDIRTLVQQQSKRLMARLAAEPTRPVDLLNEMAYEIPGPIICKMLGVPAQDREKFVEWSEQISSLIGGFVDDSDRYQRAHAAVTALETYLTDIIEKTSGTEDNLMARLVQAEADGEKLTRDEAIATGILILFGGNRTTSCMIANGLRALMLHPEQQQILRDSPELLSPAVEEIMRWEPHTKFTVRVVGEDFEWHGKHLKVGQRVFLSPLAANHDPAMFSEPGVFDIKRPNAPRHLSFGTGVHVCLGISLARLELRVVFEEMLKIMPQLQLVDAKSEWMPTLINRVQRQLLVTAKPRH